MTKGKPNKTKANSIKNRLFRNHLPSFFPCGLGCKIKKFPSFIVFLCTKSSRYKQENSFCIFFRIVFCVLIIWHDHLSYIINKKSNLQLYKISRLLSYCYHKAFLWALKNLQKKNTHIVTWKIISAERAKSRAPCALGKYCARLIKVYKNVGFYICTCIP